MPHTVLVSRTDNLGDFITTLAVCERLKKNNVRRVIMMGKTMHAALTEHNPFIDRYLNGDGTTGEILREMKGLRPDALINAVNADNVLPLLKAMKFIPIRIGPTGRLHFAWHYTHPVIQKRSRSIKSETEYNLDLCRALPLHHTEWLEPTIYFKPGELGEFRDAFKSVGSVPFQFGGYVVLHCGMRGSALNISDETYLAIVNFLTGHAIQVLLTGNSDAERGKITRLLLRLGNAKQRYAVNVSGLFTLRELCGLLKHARCYIGPSTGTTHLAAACGTAVLSYYPPLKTAGAVRWAPVNQNKRVLSPDTVCPERLSCAGERCRYYNCMDSIPVDALLREIKQSIPDLKNSTNCEKP